MICLEFQGYPADDDWAATQPAPATSACCARVLRVACNRFSAGQGGTAWDYQLWYDLPLGLPRWVAGVIPLCQNLTALHLSCVQCKELPALPLLKHLILSCLITPLMVFSLRGLTRLETLYVRGIWGLESCVWDVRACTRLLTLFVNHALATNMAARGQALYVPPTYAVALEFRRVGEWRPWLMQLGERLADLRIYYSLSLDTAASRTFIHAPELTQLRHITLCLERTGIVDVSGLCVARLLGGLPQCVESLNLEYPILWSEQAVVVVPASLRALRMKGVCNMLHSSEVCLCPPLERTQDLTFGLHEGLVCLSLVLWHVSVGLQCLDAGAPASLRGLNVQARGVDMDDNLAAEVEQRGRVLEGCEVIDLDWEASGASGSDVPPVQVVYIGRGPVHMERRSVGGRVRHWACTCGACAECLGPEAFGGVVDAGDE